MAPALLFSLQVPAQDEEENPSELAELGEEKALLDEFALLEEEIAVDEISSASKQSIPGSRSCHQAPPTCPISCAESRDSMCSRPRARFPTWARGP